MLLLRGVLARQLGKIEMAATSSGNFTGSGKGDFRLYRRYNNNNIYIKKKTP